MQVRSLQFSLLLLVSLIMSWPSTGLAQTNSFGNHYIDYHSRIIPETPKAAAFKQYGDIPIDHSTGVPQINIPLYTVEIDGVKVPISLSYHASGVRVDELAGPVGLKWTLNAGGGIFRTVKERPDEDGWLVPEMKGFVKEYMDANGNTSWYLHRTIREYLNELDHFPDDFRYDLPGYSGSFFFDDLVDSNGDTLALKDKIIKDYYDPVKIVPIEDGSRQITFKAFSPNGVSYSFGSVKERNDNSVITGSNLYGPSQGGWEYGITGWMLDTITTRNGSIISFDYEEYELDYQLDQISQRINQSRYCDPDEMSVDNHCACEGTGGPAGSRYEYINSTSKLFSSRNQLIKQIETENVKVEFIYSTDANLATWQKQLDRILIYDKIEGKEKSFEFDYEKFAGDPRLKLTSIQEKGFDGSTAKPAHKFSYFPGALPQKGSKSKDLKGFYNGKPNSSLIPFTVVANARLAGPYYKSLLADRTFDENYLKVGTLNKIEYPTGGSTEFKYEANVEYDSIIGNPIFINRSISLASNEPNVDISIEGDYTVFRKQFTVDNIITDLAMDVQIPGAIAYSSSSDICEFDPEYPNIDCSKYNIYEMNGPFIGNPLFPMDKVIGSDGEVTAGSGDYLLEIKVLTSDLTANPNAEIKADLTWIEEDPVKVQYTGGLRVSEVLNSDYIIGNSTKTEYEYYGINGDFALIDFNTKEYGDGLTKFVFASENIALDPLLQKGGYFYDSVVIKKIGESEVLTTAETYTQKQHRNGFKSQLKNQRVFNQGQVIMQKELFYNSQVSHSMQFHIVGDVDQCIAYTNAPVGPEGSQLGFGDPIGRTFIARSNVLDAEVTEHYFPGKPGKLVKTTNYTYNDYQQVIEQTTTKSQRDGSPAEELKVDFTYPDNHTELNDFVNDKYLVGVPVSKNMYDDNELIQGQYFDFDDAGNVTKIYRYTGLQQTLPSGTPAYVPQTYELNNQFEIENGVPVQVTGRNGISTVYVWSYNKQYPVAKIENATVSEVKTALSVSTVVLTNYPVGGLSQLDNLRQSLPHAMVHTYTFRPQVGVVEMTDPNGQTTTYDYDDLGRLTDVIDSSDKLLQSFQYTYFNQN